MTILSPREARIYRSKIPPHRYIIRFANDIVPLFFCKWEHARQHVSLTGAGDLARFSRPNLASSEGNLSLETTTLSLGPEIAQTSDGVKVSVTASVEFRIEKNKCLIRKLLEDGKLKSLGVVLPNRCRSIMSTEIGKLHYGDAIEHQGFARARILKALQESMGGSPENDEGLMGLEVSSFILKVSRDEKPKSSPEGAEHAEMDLANELRRLHRFYNEVPQDPEMLGWITRWMSMRAELERMRILAEGDATVVVMPNGDGGGRITSLGELLELADRQKQSAEPSAPPVPQRSIARPEVPSKDDPGIATKPSPRPITARRTGPALKEPA